MPEDRSLDDFVPGDENSDSGAPDVADAMNAPDSDATTADADTTDTGDSPPDDADSDLPSDPSDAVDPAVATSTWHAAGAACDRCGERVERRWRDDDAIVCADCASW